MLIPVANIKTVSAAANYIVMSDCHRGDGSAADEFAHNSLIYKCALEYYLKEGFTYIELGDAEELWENDSFEQIYITHTSVYELLRRFHDPEPAKTRYLKVWGNHDIDWQDNPAPLQTLFPGIEVYEAVMIANPPVSPSPILLMHGHQADPICTGLRAKISRYIVRHFWTGLQHLGIGDPTRAAENPGRCDEIDAALYRMVRQAHHGRATASIQSEPVKECPSASQANNPAIVIAGHTHRPVFANLSLTERRFLESGIGAPGIRRKEKADPVYFNAGSGVHPRCITGLEITAHNITLVKWGYSAAEDVAKPPYPLAITRTVLEEQKL